MKDKIKYLSDTKDIDLLKSIVILLNNNDSIITVFKNNIVHDATDLERSMLKEFCNNKINSLLNENIQTT